MQSRPGAGGLALLARRHRGDRLRLPAGLARWPPLVRSGDPLWRDEPGGGGRAGKLSRSPLGDRRPANGRGRREGGGRALSLSLSLALSVSRSLSLELWPLSGEGGGRAAQISPPSPPPRALTSSQPAQKPDSSLGLLFLLRLLLLSAWRAQRLWPPQGVAGGEGASQAAPRWGASRRGCWRLAGWSPGGVVRAPRIGSPAPRRCCERTRRAESWRRRRGAPNAWGVGGERHTPAVAAQSGIWAEGGVFLPLPTASWLYD